MKCESCADPFIVCGDCRDLNFMCSVGDLHDIQSALTYFIDKYPNEGSEKTKITMARILRRTWEAVSAWEENATEPGEG